MAYAAQEIAADRTRLFVSDLALQESAHVLTRDLLKIDVIREKYPQAKQRFDAKPQYPGKRWDAKALYKEEPTALSAHVPEVTRFLAAVRAIPLEVVEPPMLGAPTTPLSTRMREPMFKYDLLSADTYHLAVAEAIGAETLVTLDRDWMRASVDFNVVVEA